MLQLLLSSYKPRTVFGARRKGLHQMEVQAESRSFDRAESSANYQNTREG